jgi:hypothetical protein
LNSISTAVILSAPKPSLVAKLLGQILSNMRPNIPLRLEAVVGVAVDFLTGLFEGDKPPTLVPFLAGLVPVTLFLNPVEVIAEPASLVVGDDPVLVYFLRSIFL